VSRIKIFGRAFCLTLIAAQLALGSIAEAAGFDLRYTARVGDLNGDGRNDLYIRWSPLFTLIPLDDFSIPVPRSRRGVGNFVLQQNANATFSIVSNLSAAQLSSVAQWPAAPAALQIAPGDVNFDGAIDLIIRGVSSIASGADNQFVFAAAAPGSSPVRVVPLNATMRSFYRDVARWFLSPMVTVTEETRTYTYLGYADPPRQTNPVECVPYDGCVFRFDDADDPGAWNPVDNPNQPNVQHWFGYEERTETVTRREHSVTDPNAGPFVSALNRVLDSGSINAGFEASVFQNILDNVFGAPVVDVLRQPPPIMAMEPDSPDSLPATLHDEWRWGRLMTNILGVFWEVCGYDGEDVQACWLDITAPGFPGLDICSTHGPFDGSTPYFNYAITATQRSLASTQQRRPFWVSRYRDSCDPFAPSALGVVDEKGLGLVTMKWLRAIAAARGQTVDEQQLGLDIMAAHVQTTDGDAFGIPHLLSKRQITDYHVDVFKSYGLPGYTFGGAPFGTESIGGGFFEWMLGDWMWCPDCDKVP